MDMLITIGIKIICGILVVLVHEIPKEIVAYTLIHPIYRKKEGLKITPLSYIDPIGLIMFVLTNVGWQKPKEYNATKYRNKEKGVLAVALTGMAANLLFLVLLIPLIYIPSVNIALNGYAIRFIVVLIAYNFAMILVNLLPVPPLEMTKIIQFFSPNAYFRLIQYKQIIQVVFIILIAMNIIPLMVQSFFYLL
jgi:Zn-dependent protease